MVIFTSMHIKLYEIIPELRSYVKTICTMDCEGDADTTHLRILPDMCVELFVNYTSAPIAIIGNDLYKSSIVSFRMSRHADVQMRKGTGCIAICFHPGVAYRFFNLPMHTLADRSLELSDLWGTMANEIESKIAEAGNNQERAIILKEYLLQKMQQNSGDRLVDLCLNKMSQSASHIPISHLSSDIGITQRHLSRKFQQLVGLSPKEYLSMCRFIKSLNFLKKHPLYSLTEVAYQSGYYDQAHFNRDYKIFTGYTPHQVVHVLHSFY